MPPPASKPVQNLFTFIAATQVEQANVSAIICNLLLDLRSPAASTVTDRRMMNGESLARRIDERQQESMIAADDVVTSGETVTECQSLDRIKLHPFCHVSRTSAGQRCEINGRRVCRPKVCQ